MNVPPAGKAPFDRAVRIPWSSEMSDWELLPLNTNSPAPFLVKVNAPERLPEIVSRSDGTLTVPLSKSVTGPAHVLFPLPLRRSPNIRSPSWFVPVSTA